MKLAICITFIIVFATQSECIFNIIPSIPDAILNPGCQFKCKTGYPAQNPDYRPTSNGCGSYGFSHQMRVCDYHNACCDKHDICYGTCGKTRHQCDKDFRECVTSTTHASFLLKPVCRTSGEAMATTVEQAGCVAYLGGQAEACICTGEWMKTRMGCLQNAASSIDLEYTNLDFWLESLIL